MKKRLPLGIQTFRTIREEGCYYVDKTAYAARLVDEGAQYFLSRPRRFGKSLFADTLKELFEGNEALFDGLHVHERWDWSVRHPVVRLDFSEWHTRNEMARFEGWYASVFYSYFAASGLALTVEDSGSGGRLDMAVRCDGRVYLFEFKVVEQAGAGAALAQLRARRYADKYRALGEPIHLVGVEFSRETRNVVAFEAAPA